MDDNPADSAKKLLPLVYTDLVHPAAQVAGSTVGGVVRTLLSPVNFVVWTADEALEYAKAKVQERLERWKTPPDSIKTPPPEIVGPVVLALRFPNQDATLREMYLNLLAGAMDARYPTRSHPAFVEVLRQLTPLEARTVPLLGAWGRSFHLLGVRHFLTPGSFHTLLKHANLLGRDQSPPFEVPRQAIDNLDRLGIITVHEDQMLQDDVVYPAIEKLNQVVQAITNTPAIGGTPSHHRYLAEITDFGRDFTLAVTEPGTHSGGA